MNNSSLKLIRRVAWLSIAVVLVSVFLQLSQHSGQDMQGSMADARIGGAFTLTDQNGRQVSDSDFRGKVMLVFFGFSHCPDICPVALRTMTTAVSMLQSEEKQHIATIFITVDPERDTPEVLRDYVASFPEHVTALTGPEAAIQNALHAYRGSAEKQSDSAAPSADYQMQHSGYIYIMGADGAYLQHMDTNVDAEELRDVLINALHQRPTENTPQ